MKKKWIAALAAMMVAFCVGCKAEIPDYLIVEGTTVTGYTDDLPANLVIPKGITKIAGGAFYECDWLESVVIPGSVKVIGEDISLDEYSEKGLYIEDVLAFHGCTSLRHVTIENGVQTIGIGAFSLCDSLESVMIGKSVTTIGDRAFFDCESLVSVVIPDSVTTIGRGAFFFCDSLESVTIGKGVKTIGEEAFSDCDSLESVTIGKGVKTIGEEAFSDCDSLKEIHYSGTKAQWETVKKGDDWNDQTLASCVKCTDGEVPLPSCSVKDGVLERWYRAATEAVIPEGVTAIGEHAFHDCDSLSSVVIPNGVTTIGIGAFSFCDSLESVMIGKSVTTIGDRAFGDCKSLVSVTIPDSVTTIGRGAFSDCDSLKEIRYSGTKAQFMNIQGLNTMSLKSGVLIPCADGELIVQ